MKLRYLYSCILVVFFAANTLTMDPKLSSSNILSKVKAIQNKMRSLKMETDPAKSDLIKSNLSSCFEQFNDLDLTKIETDLRELQEVKNLLPVLFGNNRLKKLCEIFKKNSEKGNSSIMCVSVGKGGKVKVISQEGHDLNQLFCSVNYIDPHSVVKKIEKELEKKPGFSAIVMKNVNEGDKKHFVLYVPTIQIPLTLLQTGIVHQNNDMFRSYCTEVFSSFIYQNSNNT